MKSIEAAGIGAIIGILYGVVLWASTDALSLASFILYGDPTFLPIVSTWIVIVITLVALFTYPYWEPFMEKTLYRVVKEYQEQDEDDDE